MNPVAAIALRELRESLRNRWLWLFAAGFAVLAMALSRASLASAGYAGLGGFGRTAASLVNAVLLFVPLLGLTVGSGLIAADRERGTLGYLLIQPVSRGQVFLGKALGGAAALGTSLSLGFGLTALALAQNGGDPGSFLALAGFTLLLALALFGIGLAISAASRRASTASAVSLLTWLFVVFLSDLGLVGATLAGRPAPAVLFGLLLANPVQVFKVAAIHSLRTSLDALGPVGQYAMHRFGEGLPLLFLGLLLAWAGASTLAAYLLFRRSDT